MPNDQDKGALFDREEEKYTITLNDAAANRARGFPDNRISTTKYTLWNFLPKNLFESFRRISNFYFLIVVIIQLIPQISPLLPITSILPLAFVLVVSAVKEAIEDYMRYVADKTNNCLRFDVFKSEGVFESTESQRLYPGDLVRISEGQTAPADLVLLMSSSADGSCYVETSNLDGESNLKLRKSLQDTHHLESVDALGHVRGKLHCEEPNERLYRFNGRMHLSLAASAGGAARERLASLSQENLVQRGVQLRNTKSIVGVVVYAGIDTKLFLNQQPVASKFSTLERQLNRFVLLVFFGQLFICLVGAIAGMFFQQMSMRHMWHLAGGSRYIPGLLAVANFFTYFVLFNVMIPISLWVTLEVVKVAQARFMEWDEMQAGMVARTSSLNEDLGCIQHIFSDKTGTLTENVMNFHKAAVGDRVFDEARFPGSLAAARDTSGMAAEDEAVRDYLMLVALCHTALTEEDQTTHEMKYLAQSPDEAALLAMATANSVVFEQRTYDTVVVRECGVRRTYDVLATLEFSSQRRRMSVLVRSEGGGVRLLCKGADSVVFERLAPGEHRRRVRAQALLRSFAEDGLRTLAMAQRDVSQEEFDLWKVKHHEALTSIDNRDEKLELTYELLERNLLLVGISAIEDRLQDEVPHTIDYLLQAGLHIWVLTGDKQETAINIGYSCKLLKPEMELILVNVETSEECGRLLRTCLERYCVEGGRFMAPQKVRAHIAVVIDGVSLDFALRDHTHLFVQLSRACKSVIVCRATPLQKALVVRVIKQVEGKVCLAIGDGANDVSMIQEAHIGVGLMGREGAQAARASDYSITQFKHLQRLLCVHGRYSYVRVCDLVLYSFYKNLTFVLPQLWYSLFTGFTGTALYDSWVITLFNIIFTCVPPILHGCFERDIDEDLVRAHPSAYKSLQEMQLFSSSSFGSWISAALFQSFMIFWACYLTFHGSVVHSSGRTVNLQQLGLMMSTCAVLVCNLMIAVFTKTWTKLTHVGIWGSIVVYFFVIVLYNIMFFASSDFYYTLFNLGRSAAFYLLILLIPILVIGPSFTKNYWTWLQTPEHWQVLRELGSMKARPLLQKRRKRSGSSDALKP